MSGRAIAIAGMANLAFRCSVVFRFIAMDKHSRKGSVQGRRERDEAFASSTVSSQFVSSRLLQSVVVCVHRFLRYRPAGAAKKERMAMHAVGRRLAGRKLVVVQYRTQPADQGLLGQLRRRHASHPQQVDVALLYPQSQATFRVTDPLATPFWALAVSPRAMGHG